MLAEDGTTDLQRNELAQKFNCAPSQINYVLTTRFSPNRGYIIQSRRGGGGFIRVIRLDIERCGYITKLIETQLTDSINMRQANEIVEGLFQTGFIDENIKTIVLAAVSDKAIPPETEQRDALRASILKEILVKII
jgi:transcriptional regulator CtsR